MAVRFLTPLPFSRLLPLVLTNYSLLALFQPGRIHASFVPNCSLFSFSPSHSLISSFSSAVLASVISFTIYGSVNGGLNAADVFASLALFQVRRVLIARVLSSFADLSTDPFPSQLLRLPLMMLVSLFLPSGRSSTTSLTSFFRRDLFLQPMALSSVTDASNAFSRLDPVRLSLTLPFFLNLLPPTIG